MADSWCFAAALCVNPARTTPDGSSLKTRFPIPFTLLGLISVGAASSAGQPSKLCAAMPRYGAGFVPCSCDRLSFGVCSHTRDLALCGTQMNLVTNCSESNWNPFDPRACQLVVTACQVASAARVVPPRREAQVVLLRGLAWQSRADRSSPSPVFKSNASHGSSSCYQDLQTRHEDTSA
ncbi:hypothetical protein Vretimale_19527 [Volvox reticuliferus]|uniref:Uncharacterized protein n=1 Tax=Volvox reticuliferus TaxID=1737510 RepID=A0A8J4FVE5_9CHLO|nr:hypothetical protein Vretifemale_14215 [Volvox reticuliferus]GIM16957.1 hypothetical protein Vretimale_19527 [Volvox reticuliferus]